jgi:hypothetical protein
MACGYNSFKIHENLILELEKRIPELLKNYDANKLTYLTTGMVLMKHRNDSLFKNILNHPNFLNGELTKNFVCMAFYIAMSGYDKIEDYMGFFKIIEFNYFRLNEFDKRQVNEMILYLSMHKNLKENKEYFSYLMDLKNKINFMPQDLRKFSKWFMSVSTSEGLVEVLFKNYLEKKGIKYEYHKTLFNIFEVDFLIGNKIVLYLNGPFHYFIDNNRELDVSSAIKENYLRHMGYYVVSVPYESCTFLSHKIKDDTLIYQFIKDNLPKDVFQLYFKEKDNFSNRKKQRDEGRIKPILSINSKNENVKDNDLIKKSSNNYIKKDNKSNKKEEKEKINYSKEIVTSNDKLDDHPLKKIETTLVDPNMKKILLEKKAEQRLEFETNTKNGKKDFTYKPKIEKIKVYEERENKKKESDIIEKTKFEKYESRENKINKENIINEKKDERVKISNVDNKVLKYKKIEKIQIIEDYKKIEKEVIDRKDKKQINKSNFKFGQKDIKKDIQIDVIQKLL